jgi:hypothetical protein
MSSSAELQLCYKVGNAAISLFPFPHFYVENVFPQDFYNTLQENLPDPEAMQPIEKVRPVKGYKERFVLDLGEQSLATLPAGKQQFWKNMDDWLVGGRFGQLLFGKFAHLIEERYKGQPFPELYDEALLVQDVTNYKLGPHTDSPRKVITLLFYLPKDDSQSHLGTSIYIPKDPNFTCQGGPHYAWDNFEKLYSMPFAPNSLFCFLKTFNSFHGVEPVGDPDTRRWLLLYDIYAREAANQNLAPGGAAPAQGVKFSF